MFSWRTASAMFVGVVLTAAVVLALQGMLSSGGVPPAAITQIPQMPAAEVQSQVHQQPTILRAQPATQAVRIRTQDRPNYRQWPPGDPGYSGQRFGEPSVRRESDNPRLLDRETPSLRGAWLTPGALPPVQLLPAGTSPGGSEIQQPAAAHDPAPPPTPLTPSQDEMKSVHVTRANDSLWFISKERYGDPAYYLALYLHNRAKVSMPDRIEPGVAIDTPPATELRRKYPAHTPAN